MSESKRHHFVPQSILRRFSPRQAPGRVWIHDKRSGATFSTTVLQAGMERGFNVLAVNGKRINFEGDFNDIDGRMAAVHQLLMEARDLNALSAKDRIDLADAASVQLLRTKMIRSTLRSVSDQVMENLVD